jgi:molybdopterin converting factor small subunit
MVRLKLMPPLTRIVGEKEVAVDVGRASLKAVLERAAARDRKFGKAMLDTEGNLSSEYSCLVNGRRYNAADLAGVEVGEDDEIVLLMPIAGGASRGPQGSGGAREQGRCGEVLWRRGDDARFTPAGLDTCGM